MVGDILQGIDCRQHDPGLLCFDAALGVLAISSQSGSRVDTSFGNAIYVAVFMLFNIFITLYLLVRDRKSVGMQVFYGIALVLQCIALFYSQTRGAMLGVVVGFIVALVYIAWRASGPEWKTLRMWSWGLLAGIVLIRRALFRPS
jgi:hypothetical protein